MIQSHILLCLCHELFLESDSHILVKDQENGEPLQASEF